MEGKRLLMLIIGIIAALTAALSWAISAAFYKSGAQNVSLNPHSFSGRFYLGFSLLRPFGNGTST